MQLGKIMLRPIEEFDLQQIQSFRNDAAIADMLGGFSTGYSRAEIERWHYAHQGRTDEVLWAIATAEENLCIGHIGLYQIDNRVGKADFGIVLGSKPYQGKGIGRKATKAMIDYGFSQLRLRRITLSVLATNSRAIQLYESVGFQREGLLRADQYRNGSFIDTILMAILRDEARSPLASTIKSE
jgi:RimJ/RimL family protein N-acetyltransferase